MSSVAYIYDSIRIRPQQGQIQPRSQRNQTRVPGRGLLNALQTRHDLDNAHIDDLIMGCTGPVGERVGNIAM